MQTAPSSLYHDNLQTWIRQHKEETDVAAQLDQHADALTILMSLNLEPVRRLLMRCYAPSPRGGDPWDPIVLLRCLLLALLVGIPSVNKLVPALRGSSVLRALAGLFDPASDAEIQVLNATPGVGTFYDLLHRLHDGARPLGVAGYVRPSVVERRAASTPRPPGNEPKVSNKGRKKGRPAPEAPAADGKPSERTLKELRRTRDSRNPDDFLGRMADLLWVLAVRPSAERGLLGDGTSLIVAGDGSPLVTGASGHGVRSCTCNPRKSCDCPRRYADPDARSGWDAYRKAYFFGHHFYEINAPSQGHDLPLAIRLDPGNTGDHTASLLVLERVQRHLRDEEPGIKIDLFIADMGHDGAATYAFCGDHGIRPVIPLNGAPARHPTRPEIKLGDRGIPLCPASIEMAAWGSGGEGRPAFICPVKAGKLATCPLAPKEDPAWLCQPDTKYGPVTTVSTSDDPRLFPAIHRNSATFTDTYKLRTSCERSNSVKKCRFKLEQARHRRASFWLIRLHLIAVLQHASAWVAGQDARARVRALLEPPMLLAA